MPFRKMGNCLKYYKFDNNTTIEFKRWMSFSLTAQNNMCLMFVEQTTLILASFALNVLC